MFRLYADIGKFDGELVNLMVKITGAEKNSAADKNNIKPGDVLIAINNHEINDILDYKFYLSDSKIVLKLKRGGNIFEVALEKAQYADIGLIFDSYMMDGKKSCANSCIFCFVEQLPKNCLRESLYFKDDDERLSFLHGNYITLTNLDGEHINRIIKFKISPVNISVHTTNPDLRVKMMRNKRAGEVLKYIKKLDEHNININAQIVLCKGVNDGAELERTLTDLCALTHISSVAVVPAGLTKFRDGLYKLESLSKQDCEQVIDLIDKFGEENIEKFGSRIIYSADELYLTAERELPGDAYYEDYPQYENGVGMIRSFREEFYADIDFPAHPLNGSRKVSVVTGEAAYFLIKELARELEKRYKNLSCAVCKIENKFFGEHITVAGLVTGGDIISQLKGAELGEDLLIPAVMLRHERDLFLDNTSVRDVERELGVSVRIVENNAESFIKNVLGV